MKEFTTLKIIASFLKGIGLIIIVSSIGIGIFALLYSPKFASIDGIGLLSGSTSVLIAFPGLILGTIILALSETIFLFLQIERNTRMRVNQTHNSFLTSKQNALTLMVELSEKEKSAIYKDWCEKNPKKSIEDFNKYMEETF